MSDAPGVNALVNGEPIKLNEAKRTYVYPVGDFIEVVGVRELVVRPSGTHRLKVESGELIIMAPGWQAIVIEDESEEWTV